MMEIGGEMSQCLHYSYAQQATNGQKEALPCHFSPRTRSVAEIKAVEEKLKALEQDEQDEQRGFVEQDDAVEIHL